MYFLLPPLSPLQSEEEVKKQKELLSKEAQENKSSEGTPTELGAPVQVSSSIDSVTTQQGPPTTMAGSESQPRQRVQPPSPRQPHLQTAALPLPNRKGAGVTSLVLMWLLLLAISVLVARRVYLFYQ